MLAMTLLLLGFLLFFAGWLGHDTQASVPALGSFSMLLAIVTAAAAAVVGPTAPPGRKVAVPLALAAAAVFAALVATVGENAEAVAYWMRVRLCVFAALLALVAVVELVRYRADLARRWRETTRPIDGKIDWKSITQSIPPNPEAPARPFRSVDEWRRQDGLRPTAHADSAGARGPEENLHVPKESESLVEKPEKWVNGPIRGAAPGNSGSRAPYPRSDAWGGGFDSEDAHERVEELNATRRAHGDRGPTGRR